MQITLSSADFQNLKQFMQLKRQNPCLTCKSSPTSCCGCDCQKSWLISFRTAEQPIKMIPINVLMLFERYQQQMQQFQELNAELTRVEQALRATSNELLPYLDPDSKAILDMLTAKSGGSDHE